MLLFARPTKSISASVSRGISGCYAAKAGQAVVEYSMIGTLVVLVSIAGMLFVGRQVNDLMSGLKGDMRAQANAAEAANAAMVSDEPATVAGGTAPSAATDAGRVTLPNGIGKSMTVTLADGRQIQVGNYPTDLSKSIATTGANGTTMVLASMLETLTQSLLQQGAITPAESNSLMALANQGHKLAGIEAVAEQVASTCQTAQCFTGTPVSFDGKNYGSLIDLTDQIGYKPDSNSNGQELQALYNLRDQAVSSGALSDPAVKSLVLDLVDRIGTTADTVESATGPIRSGQSSPSQLVPIASSYTDKTSASICNAGGNADTGIKCQ